MWKGGSYEGSVLDLEVLEANAGLKKKKKLLCMCCGFQIDLIFRVCSDVSKSQAQMDSILDV